MTRHHRPKKNSKSSPHSDSSDGIKARDILSTNDGKSGPHHQRNASDENPPSVDIPFISPLMRLLFHPIYIIFSICIIFIKSFIIGILWVMCLRSLCMPLWRKLTMGSAADAISRSTERRRNSLRSSTGKKTTSILVLHPNAINNGGGEKVLWHILREIPSNQYNIRILCSDDTKKQNQWRELIQQYFGMRLSQVRMLDFINVKWISMLVDKAATLPFTLLLQSLVSMIGYGAALLIHGKQGDILLDTTGYAFVYPVARALGMKVVAYVHYPTISTDMLQRVKQRKEMYNNKISASSWKTQGKILYYKLFATLYGIVGGYANVVMVNSSWTFQHILHLWKSIEGRNIHILHPPVSVSTLKSVPLRSGQREKIILSVGQFRPEKNHPLQLRAFARFLTDNPSVAKDYKLVLLGSCRHQEDRKRVASLKDLCKKLNLDSKYVDFVVDAPFATLRDYLSRSYIGLHTMEDEHFGICVVEYQAAGLITLAHNSAGPRMDIVTEYNGQPTGFLARTEKEYAQKMYEIASQYGQERMRLIQENARESTQRFTASAFANSLSDLLKPVGVETRPKKKGGKRA